MTVFNNADAEYVRWLADNPEGYVLNAERKPQPGYLILHRAACKHIARTAEPPVRWTSSGYIKVCAHSTAVIERWCRKAVNGSPQPCGHCHPYRGS